MVTGSDRRWSDADDALLRSLWIEGLTCSQIGLRLGITKSAVIGRARRIGVGGRPNPIIRGGERAATDKRRIDNRPAPMDAARIAAANVAVPAVVRVVAGSDGCRWPIGDPKHRDFRFCAAPRAASRPYCNDHHAKAFVRRD
jgi:GcrA cell cycle regulator